MNDLTTFDSFRSQIMPGDVIVFDGGNTSDVVHLVTDFLSNAIQVISLSNLTHSGMVYSDPTMMLESTIAGGKNGPQLNPLRDRVAGYAGRVWWLPLSARTRDYLDFGAVWKLANAKLGKDHYNVIELAQYVLRKVPVINWIPWLYKSDDDSEVCSELCSELLAAGGLPGLKPAQITPKNLAQLRIYARCVQLAGPPANIRGFNTI